MSGINLKSIAPVPTAKEFLDIVLSKTQRKTPTVIHKGYAIPRIRNFYMRKVKFSKEAFDERLGLIIDSFPRIEDIHPFYADLMNVLYDRDHYKLALGQLSSGRRMIETVGREYLRLLKFGDSLYRCKMLKRAALGRMAKIVAGKKNALVYLEQVRQHLGRLPSIDTSARTLIVCGFPNVGKSSFMRKVSRAEVDVQPYAFTTRSLYVGHFDYEYLRWQVIDTPGLLDHPLEERNTIEMQSITALAHLRCCILFFVDISGSCGYTLGQQISLFESLRPLFCEKPVVVVCNKSDLATRASLDAEEAMEFDASFGSVTVMETSAMTDEGIMAVRNAACEKLLTVRVESKLQSGRVSSILNRIHVAVPVPRDNVSRDPVIPTSISAEDRELEIDLERRGGGSGVYSVDLRKNYILDDSSWKYDTIPELVDGKNILDFVDLDISERVLALETEERTMPRTDFGLVPFKRNERDVASKRRQKLFEIRAAKSGRSRMRRRVAGPEFDGGEESMSVASTRNVSRTRSSSRFELERSTSRVRERALQGLGTERRANVSTSFLHRAQRKTSALGRAGEADRHTTASIPKHLFSGKRKAGTHDRR